jgi:tRNA threonylcarbamoyl adenosine modification protein (Sua5/YciO/YrdC/YwlC family)
VYGIGCDILNKSAIERIQEIKNNPDIKLLSFICPNLKDISKYAKVSDYAYKAMKRLLPGPYTFILPAAKQVPKKLWNKRKSVGIRVPDHKIAITLTEALGNPIISTSATNRKGEILFDPLEIRAVFNSQVDLMLASGNLNGTPSSVIDLTDDSPVIVREGSGDLSWFIQS